MSEKPGSDAAPNPSVDDDDTAADLQRSWLTEDWAAVVVGLVLILLVFAGVIPGDLIP